MSVTTSTTKLPTSYLRGELPAIWDLLREALGDSPAARSEIRCFAQLFGQFRSHA